ncbi:MAG: hypothetical protein ACM3XS_10870 [Bacteroidota bacterium]
MLTRWLGMGASFAPDLRTVALWAAILLGLFLFWRDGRAILARYGLAPRDTPLAILAERLAKGELDLETYRRIREELAGEAGIPGANPNSVPKRVLRGDRAE